MLKPFSKACENNARPILSQLSRLLDDSASVLEIGSGTGQHAVFFGKGLPHLQWQTSDLLENHEGICLWLDEAGLHNVLPPIEFDVAEKYEDSERYDAIFMANILHILSSKQIKKCFTQMPEIVTKSALLIIYGPFNYHGEFSSPSNMRFDQWLKANNPDSGIRDFERVNKLAHDAGFILEEDKAMPANNRLLVWRFEG